MVKKFENKNFWPSDIILTLQWKQSSNCQRHRGWCIKFATGLNTKIDIVQKVYKWSNCPFVKMILLRGDHFGKKTDWSLLYFLNYVYLWYVAQSQIWCTTLWLCITNWLSKLNSTLPSKFLCLFLVVYLVWGHIFFGQYLQKLASVGLSVLWLQFRDEKRVSKMVFS